MTVIIEDILDKRSNEVFVEKAVLVTAGVEPEVEDEVVEAIDKDQCSDTMNKHREVLTIHTQEIVTTTRRREKNLLTENIFHQDSVNNDYRVTIPIIYLSTGLMYSNYFTHVHTCLH